MPIFLYPTVWSFKVEQKVFQKIMEVGPIWILHQMPPNGKNDSKRADSINGDVLAVIQIVGDAEVLKSAS